LEHPGIVPVHDVGELADGRVFYTMKFVRGRRLDHHLDETSSLPERLRIFVRICEAVAFAHAHGVLHRDLKPENIMVGPFGEVLVMDWGVAKLMDMGAFVAETDGGGTTDGEMAATTGAPPATAHGVVLGTPGYMAPEQARGEVDRVDPRSDVYSLGAVLQFLLTGQIPNEAPTAVNETGPGRSAGGHLGGGNGPPRQLAAVVEKAMAEDPDERYDTAAELAEEIERFVDGRQLLAYPESPVVRIGRFLARHRVAVILLLTYVVVRALVLLFGDS
jgi:serine/threonine protein kinase